MSKAKKSSNFYNNKFYDESIELYCNDNHWNIPQNIQNQPARSKLQSEIFSKVETEKKNIEVKIPLKDWIAMLDEQNTKNAIQYSIEKATYKAVAEFYNVEFTCTFDILVFASKQRIPLLPSSLALKNSHFKYSEHLHSEPRQDDKESCVGLHLDAHSFHPERPGRYIVTLDILCNFLTPKKNGVGLSIPMSTNNSIDITVFKKVQISVVEPAIRSKPGDTKLYNQDNTVISTRHTSFPPCSYIKIQWIDFDDEEEGESSSNSPISQMINNNNNNSATGLTISRAQQGDNAVVATPEKTKATVQQYTLLSVDEGVIVITNSFKYSVVSGSLSSLEVIVGSNVKVLSIEGPNIKKWDCNPILPLVNVSDKDSQSSSQFSEQLIKVQMSSPVETDYILRIISEIEMEGPSGTVQLTSIRAKGSEITREKGFLVVESIATVEVEQLTKDGLTLIDKSELPETLVDYSVGPLLLSYKFLDPRFKLEFKVIKHQDLSVLVAICDAAHYMATLSNEGSLLYKLVFRIKNTSQQYIRIQIPHEFNIWSTIVDGSAVKPGLENQKTVMIPLKKSSGAEKGVQKPFTVEILYKHTNGLDLLNQGNLDLLFPEIDIPISQLFVSLYLPSDYKYGKFSGNVKQVQYFSRTPPTDSEPQYQGALVPAGRGGGIHRAPQMQMQQQAFMSNANPQFNNALNIQSQSQMLRTNSNDDFDDDDDGMIERIPSLKKDEGTVGLKPVMVNLPLVGTKIMLQQLLLLQVPISITTNYKLKKSCC
ncbi:hypothetical protein DLAC_10321 [Tieghemostelium lacteum]|uniref:Uncharacterized protein n=1 Tax=Tieghemostelium lacteum TaxID=361077 RepID=A0A151Z551_TIELA|nr:hypothetical protein DLAC_10321 [Tieghemostelium lacteum]|eukprot:KYQ89090.1 hypothetical protein DLAC_10321 [Tieghemostelium lacteum]